MANRRKVKNRLVEELKQELQVKLPPEPQPKSELELELELEAELEAELRPKPQTKPSPPSKPTKSKSAKSKSAKEPKTSKPPAKKVITTTKVEKHIRKEDGYVVYSVNDTEVYLREVDGYVNATQLCKSAGKSFSTYNCCPEVKEYLIELQEEMELNYSELVECRRGGIPSDQASWVNPVMLLRLSLWLDKREYPIMTAKWITDWQEETTGGKSIPALSLDKGRLDKKPTKSDKRKMRGNAKIVRI